MATFDFHDFSQTSPAECYRWMVSLIIPRPIAWISTLSASGIVNLAPFSFFNGICSNPPTLAVSITPQADGSVKDTLRNIRETGEFVVNTSIRSEISRINQTSKAYPPETSELYETHSTSLPSTFVKPPRIAESPAQFECRLDRIIEIGDGSPGSACLVLGRILGVHVSPEILKSGRVDPTLLDPISRLGGIAWGSLGEVIQLPRPE